MINLTTSNSKALIKNCQMQNMGVSRIIGFTYTETFIHMHIYTQHTRSIIIMKKKTQHITKEIIVSLESAIPVSTYTRYHIYKSQRQELIQDNNCKKYRIQNSNSYVLEFRFTIFNMYILHLILSAYNHVVSSFASEFIIIELYR